MEATHVGNLLSHVAITVVDMNAALTGTAASARWFAAEQHVVFGIGFALYLRQYRGTAKSTGAQAARQVSYPAQTDRRIDFSRALSSIRRRVSGAKGVSTWVVHPQLAARARLS